LRSNVLSGGAGWRIRDKPGRDRRRLTHSHLAGTGAHAIAARPAEERGALFGDRAESHLGASADLSCAVRGTSHSAETGENRTRAFTPTFQREAERRGKGDVGRCPRRIGIDTGLFRVTGRYVNATLSHGSRVVDCETRGRSVDDVVFETALEGAAG